MICITNVFLVNDFSFLIKSNLYQFKKLYRKKYFKFSNHFPGILGALEKEIFTPRINTYRESRSEYKKIFTPGSKADRENWRCMCVIQSVCSSK